MLLLMGLPKHLYPIATGLIHNVEHGLRHLLLLSRLAPLLVGTRLLAALPRALLHHRVLCAASHLIYTGWLICGESVSHFMKSYMKYLKSFS
jgi:hypothetical protein